MDLGLELPGILKAEENPGLNSDQLIIKIWHHFQMIQKAVNFPSLSLVNGFIFLFWEKKLI